MIKKSLKNKKGIIFLTGLILLMALFLRIYKINTNLIFVYDQGRDALIIRDILKGKLTLIGPTTGIPGFFLGPFYYYLITPFYWLGKGNPTYPLFFLNLLCLGGIILAGLMAKKKNNWLAFFLCLILLATNFSHIRQSRWLSNPNPIFFLAPLYFFLLTFLLKKEKIKGVKISLLWAMAGLILGLSLQTELANALFFIPTTVLVFLIRRKKINFFYLADYVLTFCFTLVPLVFFNLRHDFIMIASLKAHFADRSQKINLLEVIKARPKFYYQVLTFFFSPKFGWVFLVCLGIVVIYLLLKKFWQDDLLTILASWFFVPLFLMLFYTSNRGLIWDYYLITQPIPLIILFSLAMSDLIKFSRGYLGLFLKLWFLVIFLILIRLNFNEWLILQSPEANRISLGKMKEAVDFIYQDAQGQPFNLEIFVPNFLPAAYEYLFSWYGFNQYGYSPTPEYEREKLFYFLMEPGQKYAQGEQYWRNKWYEEKKHSGKIIKTKKLGDIDIERRERLSL